MDKGSAIYRDSTGSEYTAEQVEQDYKKSLIVSGRRTEGAEYEQGLAEWKSTYHEVTHAENRSKKSMITAFVIGVCLSALIAIIVLMSGGGLIAFVLIFAIGCVMSFGLAGIVMMITTPKRA